MIGHGRTDSTQAATAARTYDAFGIPTSPTPFGYVGAQGYQEDGDSGLKLLGHRYYDPSTGRFLTRDRVKDGRNWYVYCSNNALKLTDPMGLWPYDPDSCFFGHDNYGSCDCGGGDGGGGGGGGGGGDSSKVSKAEWAKFIGMTSLSYGLTAGVGEGVGGTDALIQGVYYVGGHKLRLDDVANGVDTGGDTIVDTWKRHPGGKTTKDPKAVPMGLDPGHWVSQGGLPPVWVDD